MLNVFEETWRYLCILYISSTLTRHMSLGLGVQEKQEHKRFSKLVPWPMVILIIVNIITTLNRADDSIRLFFF